MYTFLPGSLSFNPRRGRPFTSLTVVIPSTKCVLCVKYTWEFVESMNMGAADEFGRRFDKAFLIVHVRQFS